MNWNNTRNKILFFSEGSRSTPWTTASIVSVKDKFECKLCPGHVFETKLNASNHYIKKHLDKLQEFEVCQYCIDVFPSRKILKKHCDNVHPNVLQTMYKCKHCTGTKINPYGTRSVSLIIMKDHYKQGYYNTGCFKVFLEP